MRISDWSSDVCSSDPVALDMLDRAEALAHGEPDVLRGHIVLEIDEGIRPRGIAIGRQFAAADAGRGDIALDRIAAWFSGTARRIRSEERSVGKVCVVTCSARGSLIY